MPLLRCARAAGPPLCLPGSNLLMAAWEKMGGGRACQPEQNGLTPAPLDPHPHPAPAAVLETAERVQVGTQQPGAAWMPSLLEQ